MNRNALHNSVLAGFLVACVLFMLANISAHQSEAMYFSGWIQSKIGNLEAAERLFERAKYVALGKNEPLFDRANVAFGAMLTLTDHNEEAMAVLMREANGLSWREGAELNSKRLLALGNARARTALGTQDEEYRRLGLQSALSAYTGAYRLNRDKEAAENYAVIESLLKKEQPPEKPKENQPDDTSEPEKKPEPPKGENQPKTPEKNPKKEDSPPQQNNPPDNPQRPEDDRQDKNEKKDDGAGNQEPPKKNSPPPNAPGNWTNGGAMRPLRGDPGGARWSNGSIPLTDAERQELENSFEELESLQKQRGNFVRPDGKPEDRNDLPNALRDIFSGDPFFRGIIPEGETGKNGKTW